MNYKILFPSRIIRLKILALFSFIPDKIMISFQYLLKTKRFISWGNPSRYTEKLQWLKLYYRDPLMIQCVDKYEVRQYVSNCGYQSLLTKCYGVFDKPNDINYDILPNKFVIKDTLGGGGNSIMFIYDKNKINKDELSLRLDKWTSEKTGVKSGGREWPYYSGKRHRIIIEELLPSDPSLGGLTDYKFLCFNGKPIILYVLTNRVPGKEAECGIFDINFNQLPVIETDEKALEHTINKPLNYDAMVKVAEELSKPFPCSRIDLYNIDGIIYFGEITFFDSSGYMEFKPDEFDFTLGSQLYLPNLSN